MYYFIARDDGSTHSSRLRQWGNIGEMLDQSNRKAKKIFIDELKKEEQQIINLTIENVRRIDREAEEIITREMKLLKVEGIGQMTVDSRIHFIKSLKVKGITNRQIMGI